VNGSSHAKRALDRARRRAGRLHDLHSIARRLLTDEQEVSRDIAELVLGHVQKGVEGTTIGGPTSARNRGALQRSRLVEWITQPPARQHCSAPAADGDITSNR
jgi:hypothetical protein